MLSRTCARCSAEADQADALHSSRGCGRCADIDHRHQRGVGVDGDRQSPVAIVEARGPEPIRDLSRGPVQDRVRVNNAGRYDARCRSTIAADLTLDRGSNIGAACWFVRMCAAIGILRRRRSVLRIGQCEGVSWPDTNETLAGYARPHSSSNSTTPRPSRKCQRPRCAEARSMPEAAHASGPRSARSAEALTAPSTAPS